jgi:hypothetical protein
MQFSRFMDSRDFARELEKLRAYRGDFVGEGLLESLEQARLLIPRVRIRFPAPIARRFWFENHDWAGRPKQDLEPDGPRWDASEELREALHRWCEHTLYGPSNHPLDEPDPRFTDFIENPAMSAFQPWNDMRVEVSNDLYPELFDSGNVGTYYSSWQILLAAEVADAGVHFRLDLANEDIARSARQALWEGKAPGGSGWFHLLPVHAARAFRKHERFLDAVTWCAEETERAFQYMLKDRGPERFRLSEQQGNQYRLASADVARKAALRHQVGTDELISLCQFLAEHWAEWDRDGRPLIADAYKSFLAKAVRMTMHVGNFDLQTIRDRIGRLDGWFEPILDKVWPDWSKQQQKRIRMTLKSAMAGRNAYGVSDDDIDAFVDFLAENGLEALYWRVHSFEQHAFRGNAFAIEGMQSDLQGLALTVEHVAAALGRTRNQLPDKFFNSQLYEKFRVLWRDEDVSRLLKDNRNFDLARQPRLAANWVKLKEEIAALRRKSGGEVVADLVMAHRIRGGAHAPLPEDDQLELENQFLTLLRAALLTFVEVQRPRPQQGGAPD